MVELLAQVMPLGVANVVVAVSVVAILTITGAAVAQLVARRMRRSEHLAAFASIGGWGIRLGGFGIAIVVVGDLGEIATLIAGLSVGIAFGLAFIAENGVSGIFLNVGRRLAVGQIVTVAGFYGRVAEIGLMRTTLFMPGGAIVTVPNKAVQSGSIERHAESSFPDPSLVFHGHSWVELRKANEVLRDTANQVLRTFGATTPTAHTAYCGEVAEGHWPMFRLTYQVPPAINPQEVADRLTLRCQEALIAEDLDVHAATRMAEGIS